MRPIEEVRFFIREERMKNLAALRKRSYNFVLQAIETGWVDAGNGAVLADRTEELVEDYQPRIKASLEGYTDQVDRQNKTFIAVYAAYILVYREVAMFAELDTLSHLFNGFEQMTLEQLPDNWEDSN